MHYEERGKKQTEQGILWTARAVAREFGVSDGVWKKWVRKKEVPAPNIRDGCRIYYAEKELPAIKRAISRILARHAARSAGWSRCALANEIGIPPQVFQYHIGMGNIPSPSHGDKYTVKEACRIKDYFALRKNIKKTHFNLQNGLLAVGCTQTEIDWATKNHRNDRAELLKDIPCQKLGNGRKDTWFSPESLARIRDRIRLWRGKQKLLVTPTGRDINTTGREINICRERN